MTEIHSSAAVSPKAELGPGVKVGPFCVIGDHVTIGADTEIGPHGVIEGYTTIGERNRISPFVCIGTPPQDIGYKGEETRVKIGDDNVIREYVSIHRATIKENWETVVGSNNFIMAYCHIAHDCVLGDRIIMANVATLGGHAHVGDGVNFGGITAIHQFVHIGAYAFLGGMTGVGQDIPPYMMAIGIRGKLIGVNQKGLIRNGFSKEVVAGIKKAFQIIWRQNRKFDVGIQQVRDQMKIFPELEVLLEFLENSERGVMR